jgi:hypothetical protein
MMNTPSMYSVDQLLKARQNGVPDYVVVPMLQKAMAQKQAMAQQQALQQGMNPPPPVADQILDAAHNDVMQEHMARQVEEKPKPRGIDSLPSGIDEEDYAGGGIIAFAGGGDVYPEFDASPYADPYAANEIDPVALKEQYKSMVGTDPNIAKQEERIKSREEGLKSEEDKAPWLALMHAGLATMAGTSPNTLANIGAGATKGLESYGESKKNLSARADKLDDLRSKIEESQRAEALTAANYGMNSAEHRKQANVTAKLKGAEAKESHIKNAMGYGIEKEKVAVDREGHQLSAGNNAAHLAETIRHNKAVEGGMGGVGGKPMTANHIADMLSNRLKELSVEEKAIIADDELTPEEKEYELANIKGVRRGYQSQRLDFLKGKPVDIGYLTELEDVKNTPYSAQSVPQAGAVVKPAPIGKTSVSNW